MSRDEFKNLSRREREVMNVVYELGEASVSDVCGRLNDEEHYDSIRITLGILVKKGHLASRRESRKYIYTPIVPRRRASRSATKSLVRTFFGNSPKNAIMAMIDMSSSEMTAEELAEIASYIRRERSRAGEEEEK